LTITDRIVFDVLKEELQIVTNKYECYKALLEVIEVEDKEFASSRKYK
jgi:hypothetical protein